MSDDIPKDNIVNKCFSKLISLNNSNPTCTFAQKMIDKNDGPPHNRSEMSMSALKDLNLASQTFTVIILPFSFSGNILSNAATASSTSKP